MESPDTPYVDQVLSVGARLWWGFFGVLSLLAGTTIWGSRHWPWWVWACTVIAAALTAQQRAWKFMRGNYVTAIDELDAARAVPVPERHARELARIARHAVQSVAGNHVCDYPDGPGTNSTWRDSFQAHEPDAVACMDRWADRVSAVTDAHAAFDARLARELEDRQMTARPYLPRGLIDRITDWTLIRARRGQLQTPFTSFGWRTMNDNNPEEAELWNSWLWQDGPQLLNQDEENPCDAPGIAVAKAKSEQLFHDAQMWPETASIRDAEVAREDLRRQLQVTLGELGRRTLFYGRCNLCSGRPLSGP